MTVTRDELHRLVEEVPSEELDNVSEYLRGVAHAEGSASAPRRVFQSMGVGEGPSDLGCNAKDIARQELGTGRKAE